VFWHSWLSTSLSLGTRECAGCVEKQIPGSTTETICAGPLAPPGELDADNLEVHIACIKNTRELGCTEADDQFKRETGCTQACKDTFRDTGPRLEICAKAPEATCEKTPVPCNVGPGMPSTPVAHAFSKESQSGKLQMSKIERSLKLETIKNLSRNTCPSPRCTSSR
jgi:hypothetical protein